MKTENTHWIEIEPAFCGGRAWRDTAHPFDRLPANRGIEKYERLWQKSHLAAGISVAFKTDSPAISVRWSGLEFEEEPGPYNTFSVNGFDLYAYDAIDEDWRWVGLTKGIHESEKDEFTLKSDHPSGLHRYLMYFPMEKTVKRAWLGLNAGSFFEFEPPRTEPPLLYYGTSLINGASSSRPGLSLAARLAREFDLPLLNFGFSGSAEMQIELADLVAELKTAIVFADVLQNLDLSRMPERVAPFLRRVASSQSGVPVFVLENYPSLSAFWRPGACKTQRYWWNFYHKIFRNLRKDLPNLHYIRGLDLMGMDRETSADGVHANDLGFDRMFHAIVRQVRRTCPEFGAGLSAREKKRRYLEHFK